MLRVGLTGGIGSGKSTVAGRLAEHGAVVIDSDRLAREVVEPGTDGLAEVVAAFGTEVLTEDGELDRGALAGKVFNDDAARTRLNGILHPRIAARTAELMAAALRDAVVVHDVPLLVENRLGAGYHLVLVVDAPVDVRVRRVVADRGMSEEDARARIAAQAGEADRRAAADVWLDNGGARDEVLAEVDSLWADRLVRFEGNVRLGRRSEYGSPRLVEADPTWPAQAARLAARISAAAGGARVDHIGSTSIAGMPAKDVIDLQLTVASMAEADAVADSLGAAGFPRHPTIEGDNPKAYAPEPEQWRKRYHNSADPGRSVNLHVRVAGSFGWRFALLFPAWLRADRAAFDEYATLKRDLAAHHGTEDTTDGYAEAKEPWFDTAAPRAIEWADRTAWHPNAS